MTDTTIVSLTARRIWDSRGLPTVEAEMTLAGGASGRGVAPAGASTGSGEALDRRDGGERFGGKDVTGAIEAVRGEIADAVRGMDAADQATIDGVLVALDATPQKSRLGGNATIAVSLAAAHAAANADGIPLWRRLADKDPIVMPLPEIQIFGGGAHAGRRIDIQDILVVCPGARSFTEALEWTAEIYHAAGAIMIDRGARFGVADEGGWWPAFESDEAAIAAVVEAIIRAGLEPGREAAIALDVAASEFGQGGRYELKAFGGTLDRNAWCDVLLGWLDRFPILSVEDPFAEDDAEGFAAFMSAAGDRVQVVGDDFLVTDAHRIRRAAADGTANAVLIKPNQRGTLTEAKAAVDAARDTGLDVIVSARSGETEDTSVVDLAIGWRADGLKVGSFARSERMAKWNAAIRIEEELGDARRFAAPFANRLGYR